MTDDDIMLMAQKAGPLTQGPFKEWCKRFANLAATAKAEECAKVVDHILKEGGGTWGDAIRARSQT
jgi:hypothetical protein